MLAALAERPAMKACRDVACCGDGAWLISQAMAVPPARTRAAISRTWTREIEAIKSSKVTVRRKFPGQHPARHHETTIDYRPLTVGFTFTHPRIPTQRALTNSWTPLCWPATARRVANQRNANTCCACRPSARVAAPTMMSVSCPAVGSSRSFDAVCALKPSTTTRCSVSCKAALGGQAKPGGSVPPLSAATTVATATSATARSIKSNWPRAAQADPAAVASLGGCHEPARAGQAPAVAGHATGGDEPRPRRDARALRAGHPAQPDRDDAAAAAAAAGASREPLAASRGTVGCRISRTDRDAGLCEPLAARRPEPDRQVRVVSVWRAIECTVYGFTAYEAATRAQTRGPGAAGCQPSVPSKI
eukprot:scaffold66686_cov57-Phaeocystis_antarctica.AAC.2